MTYMGSKRRIAKYILPIMLNEATSKGITTWVEPFVGGGNLIDKVPDTFKRIGFDKNPHAIQALIAIRDHVTELPTVVTEEDYRVMLRTEPSPITSWCRFVCSFGGMFEHGYAREGKRGYRNYAAVGVRNALKQSPNLQNVTLSCADYSDLDFENCMIYCDPPYFGSSGYSTCKFDHTKFWQWVRNMSRKNVVFVSEYVAPDDFISVWEGNVLTNFTSTRKTATHTATEKLFRFSNQ